jgi:hypothetical protein
VGRHTRPSELRGHQAVYPRNPWTSSALKMGCTSGNGGMRDGWVWVGLVVFGRWECQALSPRTSSSHRQTHPRPAWPCGTGRRRRRGRGDGGKDGKRIGTIWIQQICLLSRIYWDRRLENRKHEGEFHPFR